MQRHANISSEAHCCARWAQLQEYQFDYTLCKKHNTNQTCASVIAKDPRLACVCYEIIHLPADFQHTVHVYYGLTNYYQNFRLYVSSRDDQQLLGHPQVARYPCKPLDVDPRNNFTIFPCGLVANSLFNDTFRLKYKNGPGGRPLDVPLSFDNISWPSDLTRKFHNPEKWDPAGTVKPPNWEMPVHQLRHGLQNEAFIVWMRTAALPSLRKLYGRVERTGFFSEKVPQGEYILEIHYRYPVVVFEGTKRLILSNASWMGSRNPFVAISYFAVGCLCVVLGVAFKAIDRKFSSM
ncbi:hypothetical protein HPB48_014604 [Haemaphysalis longicornis]|uniref:Cell cycle control protein 50A n=1 Tax=Haemaphysalis longicornis TaxID=44386 RepID=A0A9J6GZ23_HAELO|nr:hypothetical protein HPB48_014604 [Haemaphysalis longicornis]